MGDVHVLYWSKILLATAAILLIIVLMWCPPTTWMSVMLCFGPAFLWDINVQPLTWALYQSLFSSLKDVDNATVPTSLKIWSVKRIPGVKAPLAALIRVYDLHTASILTTSDV